MSSPKQKTHQALSAGNCCVTLYPVSEFVLHELLNPVKAKAMDPIIQHVLVILTVIRSLGYLYCDQVVW